MTAGMLSDSGVAVPPMTVFGFAFEYISTAIAPALAALVSLTEKSQVPRAIEADAARQGIRQRERRRRSDWPR